MGFGHGRRPESAPSAERAEKPEEKKKRPGSFLREAPVLIVVAVVLALLIKTFLIQTFYIPSGSMERTLHGCPGCEGDRVLVSKLAYDFHPPHRGDIVVFSGEGTNFPDEVHVPPPANEFQRVLRKVGGVFGVGPPSESDFVKRVIGLPGDTVRCCDARGRIEVNGVPLNEPYVYNGPGEPRGVTQPFAPVTVGKGQLFVMGDHRDDSSDSRMNGTIPEDSVIGRAFARVWPLGRFKLLSAPDYGRIP